MTLSPAFWYIYSLIMNNETGTPQFKPLRRAYGFDEVAIVPGDVTINPDQTNPNFKIGAHTMAIPILAAAMDAVTDVDFAILLSGS